MRARILEGAAARDAANDNFNELSAAGSHSSAGGVTPRPSQHHGVATDAWGLGGCDWRGGDERRDPHGRTHAAVGGEDQFHRTLSHGSDSAQSSVNGASTFAHHPHSAGASGGSALRESAHAGGAALALHRSFSRGHPHDATMFGNAPLFDWPAHAPVDFGMDVHYFPRTRDDVLDSSPLPWWSPDAGLLLRGSQTPARHDMYSPLNRITGRLFDPLPIGGAGLGGQRVDAAQHEHAPHPTVAPVLYTAPSRNVVLPHSAVARSIARFASHSATQPRSAAGARPQRLPQPLPARGLSAAVASAATAKAYDDAQRTVLLAAAVAQLPMQQPALVFEGAPPFILRFANDAWVAAYRFPLSEVLGKRLAHLPNLSEEAKSTLAVTCLSIGCMSQSAPLYSLECKAYDIKRTAYSDCVVLHHVGVGGPYRSFIAVCSIRHPTPWMNGIIGGGGTAAAIDAHPTTRKYTRQRPRPAQPAKAARLTVGEYAGAASAAGAAAGVAAGAPAARSSAPSVKAPPATPSSAAAAAAAAHGGGGAGAAARSAANGGDGATAAQALSASAGAGAAAVGAQPKQQAATHPQANSCCVPGCCGRESGCGCGCGCTFASGLGAIASQFQSDPASTIRGEEILEPGLAAKRQRRVQVQARYRDRNKQKIEHFRRVLEIGIPALTAFTRANADVGSIRIGLKCVQLARRYCTLGGKLPARCLQPMQVPVSALSAAAAAVGATAFGVPHAAAAAPAVAAGAPAASADTGCGGSAGGNGKRKRKTAAKDRQCRIRNELQALDVEFNELFLEAQVRELSYRSVSCESFLTIWRAPPHIYRHSSSGAGGYLRAARLAPLHGVVSHGGYAVATYLEGVVYYLARYAVPLCIYEITKCAAWCGQARRRHTGGQGPCAAGGVCTLFLYTYE